MEEGQTIQCPKKWKKDKQYNVQRNGRRTNNTMSKEMEEGQTIQRPKKKAKKTNNDLQNATQKTKDLATRTSLKTGGERRCSGNMNSSCSKCGTRYSTIFTNPVMTHE
jgi:hypothetical protein